MCWPVLLLLLTTTPILANDIDEKLQGYITLFKLKPLERPKLISPELFQLGRSLFLSRKLSGNNNISCADCHHPSNLTHDALPLALGEGAVGIQTPRSLRLQAKGKILGRNTPALFNLSDVDVMFWDGRVSFDPVTSVFKTPIPLRRDVSATLKSALAAQAIFPIITHDEMLGAIGSNPIASAASTDEAWDMVVDKLIASPHFRKAFATVFPNEKINIGHVGEALAAFQSRAFAFDDTPYDRYLKGEVEALTYVQKEGMDIFFGKGKCGECHNGPHLSNFEFHNVGVPQIGPGVANGDDLGRGKYDFRVPPLRNIALTAPYMHDGAFQNLDQVAEHYDSVFESLRSFNLAKEWENYFDKLYNHDHSKDELRIAYLSPDLVQNLEFEEEEEEALVQFLTYGLTDFRLINRIAP